MTIQELLDALNAVPEHRRGMSVSINVEDTHLHALAVGAGWDETDEPSPLGEVFAIRIDWETFWINPGDVHGWGR